MTGMMRFLDWAFHHETPEWIGFFVALTILIIGSAYFVLTVVALLAGYWLVPVVLLVVIPAFLVAKAYAEREKP